MDPIEFNSLLETYPIVRRKNYCKIKWNSVRRTTDTNIHNILHENSTENAKDVEKKAKFDTNADFYDCLGEYLCNHFSAHDIKNIIYHFKNCLSENINNMNLEDVDDICKNILNVANTTKTV